MEYSYKVCCYTLERERARPLSWPRPRRLRPLTWPSPGESTARNRHHLIQNRLNQSQPRRVRSSHKRYAPNTNCPCRHPQGPFEAEKSESGLQTFNFSKPVERLLFHFVLSFQKSQCKLILLIVAIAGVLVAVAASIAVGVLFLADEVDKGTCTRCSREKTPFSQHAILNVCRDSLIIRDKLMRRLFQLVQRHNLLSRLAKVLSQ